MRIRTVKPTFFTDQRVTELSYLARLLYVGLWCYADDEGRFDADPLLIRGALFPRDRATSLEAVTQALDELLVLGRVRLYRHNGELFGDIPTFRQHQHINRPRASQRPAWTPLAALRPEPSMHLPAAPNGGLFSEPSLSAHGIVTDGSGSGNGSETAFGREVEQGNGSEARPSAHEDALKCGTATATAPATAQEGPSRSIQSDSNDERRQKAPADAKREELRILGKLLQAARVPPQDRQRLLSWWVLRKAVADTRDCWCLLGHVYSVQRTAGIRDLAAVVIGVMKAGREPAETDFRAAQGAWRSEEAALDAATAGSAQPAGSGPSLCSHSSAPPATGKP